MQNRKQFEKEKKRTLLFATTITTTSNYQLIVSLEYISLFVEKSSVNDLHQVKLSFSTH